MREGLHHTRFAWQSANARSELSRQERRGRKVRNVLYSLFPVLAILTRFA